MRHSPAGMLVLCVTIMVGLMLAPAYAQDNPVVATVNGQPIMKSRLVNELLLRWGDITLAGMLHELAIQQAAAEAGVTVTDAEVDHRAQKLQTSVDMQAANTGRTFTQWLAERKLTMHALRASLHADLLLEKMVEDQVSITDQQVAESWERSRESFRRPEAIHVAHICVKTKDEAETIRASLLAGQAFGEAAAQHSIDPYTKDREGNFGWVKKGDKPFQIATFALTEDGQISQPVQTVMGWHLIKRIEYRPTSIPDFADVQDEIRGAMERQLLLQLMGAKRAEVLSRARIERESEPADLVTP